MPYHDSVHSLVYSAPVGVPLNHAELSVSEQTFTQIDIGHPKEFGPVSTPKSIHEQKGMNEAVFPIEVLL